MNTPIDLEYELIEVTPQLAEEWLKSQGSNRNKSDVTIKSYVSAMRSGKWYPSKASPIMFGIDGRLRDGQHRLYAIIQLAQPVKMYVCKNVPDELLDNATDEVRARSVADRLNIKYNKTTGGKEVPAVRYVIIAEGGTPPKNTLLLTEQVIENLGEEHVSKVCSSSIKTIPAPLRAALILARPINPDKIDDLINKIENLDFPPGTILAIGRMITLTKKQRAGNLYRATRAFCKGITAYLKGQDILELKMNSDGYSDLMKLRHEKGLTTRFLPDSYRQAKWRTKITKRSGMCAFCKEKYKKEDKVLIFEHTNEICHEYCKDAFLKSQVEKYS